MIIQLRDVESAYEEEMKKTAYHQIGDIESVWMPKWHNGEHKRVDGFIGGVLGLERVVQYVPVASMIARNRNLSDIRHPSILKYSDKNSVYF